MLFDHHLCLLLAACLSTPTSMYVYPSIGLSEANGSLDSTFPSTGLTKVDPGGRVVEMNAVVLVPTG